MKIVPVCIFILFITCNAKASDKTYIASTPANATVKNFLGITVADSIDFIRWKIVISDNKYSLSCNYGLSKPNTNGFHDGGKMATFNGQLKQEQNFYLLIYGNKKLKLAILNEDLLHITNDDNSLMVGNGGWSFTLNTTSKKGIENISTKATAITFKDSTVFDGRSPCAVPGIIPAGKQCYKLKWRVILYGNTALAQNGKCKIYGTGYRNMNGRPGEWKLAKNENGDVRYEILDENGNPFIWLREADKNILYFTDASGKLLVGDHDFSYSLNKIR